MNTKRDSNLAKKLVEIVKNDQNGYSFVDQT